MYVFLQSHVAVLLGQTGSTLGAVSYTHLDVYKRQAHSSPPAKTGHAQDHMRYVPSLFMGGYADRSRYMYPRLGTQAHVTIHMLLFYSDSRFFASREDKKVDAKSPPQHCEGLGCLCCFIRRDETYLQNLHGLHPRPVPWHCASQRTWERPAGTWRRSGRPLPA